MSTDSLTILHRIQERRDRMMEEQDNQIIELGSGIRRLVTSKDQQAQNPLPDECELEKIGRKTSLHFPFHGEDDRSQRTTASIDTKSNNASTNIRQKDRGKVRPSN